MGKLVKFHPKKPCRKREREPVTLIFDEMLFAGVDLGNLIDALIVPRMVDDWMSRIDDAEASATEDTEIAND
jgi:hypothetical protein